MVFKISIFLSFLFVLIFFVSPRVVSAQSICFQGSTLNIVAHEDDDLLFLSPDILSDIRNKRCVRTVFVTAGDANLGSSYWGSREDGMRAAYALMAGTFNSWRQTIAGIPNHPIPIYTLRANPSLSLVFLRLPDGNWDGSGFSNNNYESIKKLWQGNIQTVKAVDGSSLYNKQDLVTTLLTLMTDFRPDKIRTQNYVDGYSGADHSDHSTTAFAALEAHAQYPRAHTFIGYLGYGTLSRPVNLSGGDLAGKRDAFFLYGNYDSNVCNSFASCQNSPYGAWLERQYTVGSLGPVVSNSPTPTPTNTPSPTPIGLPSQAPGMSTTPTPTRAFTVTPGVSQIPRPTRSITFPVRPTRPQR